MLVFLIIVEVSSLIMLFYRQRQPLWIVLAVLIVSVYPMMFLIWHAEPLEIERHAAQIGVQFRLAGWISLVLLLTEILRWIQHRINPGMYKILPLDD